MSTLGLTMIVGPNEAEELERCLQSINARESFDEISIVATSNDQNVMATILKYTDKVATFKWNSDRHAHGDFAGARNLSLQGLTTDYWMWLDADDVILDNYRDAWMRLVESIKADTLEEKLGQSFDTISVPYAIVHDLNGIPQVTFMKERIFKRSSSQRWERPVHEKLVGIETIVKCRNFSISHLPEKANFVSAERNVRILQHEYDQGNKEPAIRYYLGRDLIQSNRVDQGIKILEELVDGMDGDFSDLNTIAIDILGYYAYRQTVRFKPTIDDVKMENAPITESWARFAIACNQNFAEPFVILGDLYCLRGRVDRAETLYLTAMQKTLTEGRVQSLPFYKEIPADRLSRIMANSDRLEEALFYNRKAIDCDPNNQEYQKMRNQILEALQ